MDKYIPWIISALLLLFAILTYVRTGSKEKKNEIKEEDLMMNGIKESLLKVNMKLDQVCATTNETRADIKALNKDLQGVETRVAVLERDLKTAFSRIDEVKIQNRVSGN